MRGVEAMDNNNALMDLTAYGRQETWEDSPPGWPQRWGRHDPHVWRINGRHTAQWFDSRRGATTTSVPGRRSAAALATEPAPEEESQ